MRWLGFLPVLDFKLVSQAGKLPLRLSDSLCRDIVVTEEILVANFGPLPLFEVVGGYNGGVYKGLTSYNLGSHMLVVFLGQLLLGETHVVVSVVGVVFHESRISS